MTVDGPAAADAKGARKEARDNLLSLVATISNVSRRSLRNTAKLSSVPALRTQQSKTAFGHKLNQASWFKDRDVKIDTKELLSLETVGDLVQLIEGKVDAAQARAKPPTPRKSETLTERLHAQVTDASLKTAFEAQKALDSKTGGFETRTGIELTGATLKFAVAPRGLLSPSQAGADGRARWHYQGPVGQSASVAVGFQGGGIVVPCLPDFVTSITVAKGRVVNVTFVPARNGTLWNRFQHVESQVNELRAQVAAVTRFGRLDIEPEQASDFAETIRDLKAFDPTLGLYAAYGYAEIRAVKDIRSVQSYMIQDLGVRIYDIAMLAARGQPEECDRNTGVVPFCPLLSQGWSYALGYGITWPKVIQDAVVVPSLWTTFDSESIKAIADAIQRGDLQ
jgi:hypothetical protein